MEQEMDLVERVKQYLCLTHELKYNSRMNYTHQETFFKLEWLLADQDHPLVMMGDFVNEEQFFKYVCKEIDTKRFFLRKYFVAKMTDTTITL